MDIVYDIIHGMAYMAQIAYMVYIAQMNLYMAHFNSFGVLKGISQLKINFDYQPNGYQNINSFTN